MNFALSAIILVLLLSPGAVVIKAYYSSVKLKEVSIHVPLNELLFRGIVFSFFIHTCAICVLKSFGFLPQLDILYKIVLGNVLEFSTEIFIHLFLQFASYNITIIFGSWVIGKIFKFFVRRFNFDIRFQSLKNVNHWYLIFSARYLQLPGIPGKAEDADVLWLDVLTTDQIIYSGYLIDFEYSPLKDKLEHIMLSDTRKRNFKKDPTDKSNVHSTGKEYKLSGDVFYLPAEKIININIYYITLQDFVMEPIAKSQLLLDYNDTSKPGAGPNS